jgi:hypothetical protein
LESSVERSVFASGVLPGCAGRLHDKFFNKKARETV